MRKKTNQDVLRLVSIFQSFVKNKPTPGRMYEEIQMMRFKVKPLQGNLTEVNLRNQKFLETLWSLGKLDEFFQKEYPKLSFKNKQIFTKIFDDLYHKYQQDLNKINLYQNKFTRQNPVLEIEIFKETDNQKKTN